MDAKEGSQRHHHWRRKGWCAFAAKAIERGAFVCQYAGEVISTPAARQRLAEYDSQAPSFQGHALLVGRPPSYPISIPYKTCSPVGAALRSCEDPLNMYHGTDILQCNAYTYKHSLH